MIELTEKLWPYSGDCRESVEVAKGVALGLLRAF